MQTRTTATATGDGATELAAAREQFATERQRIAEQTAAEPVAADETIAEAAPPELTSHSDSTSSADDEEMRALAGKSPTSSWGRSEFDRHSAKPKRNFERIREEFDNPSIAPADQAPAEADVDEFMALEAEQEASEDEISSTLVIDPSARIRRKSFRV